MKNAVPATRRRKGRPLSFDPGVALERAMLLFWRHGYEATSLADLTKAMGVAPPSVYAAFGDKKSLFRAAVRRYLAQPVRPEEAIACAPSAEAAARIMLEGAAVAFTGSDTPPGCLLASSAIAVSTEADDVRQELATIRGEIETALHDRIRAGVAEGELDGHADPAVLAAYVMTVVQGLSTMARDGATREKLQQVARLAMTAWPRASIPIDKPPGNAQSERGRAKVTAR